MSKLSKTGGVGSSQFQRDLEHRFLPSDDVRGLRRLPCIILIALLLGLVEAAIVFSRQLDQKETWAFWLMPCLFLGILFILRQRFLNIGIGGGMFEFIWVPVYNVFILMRLMSLPEQWVLNPKLDLAGWIQYLSFSVLALFCIAGYVWVSIELIN